MESVAVLRKDAGLAGSAIKMAWGGLKGAAKAFAPKRPMVKEVVDGVKTTRPRTLGEVGKSFNTNLKWGAGLTAASSLLPGGESSVASARRASNLIGSARPSNLY